MLSRLAHQTDGIVTHKVPGPSVIAKKRASNNDKVEQLFLPTLLLFSTLSLADEHTDAVGSTPQSPVILQIPELATMLLCRVGG